MGTTTVELAEIVEVDPRARVPLRQQWRYTARPEWSSSGESLWMRLSKFSHCNRMSLAELARLFSPQATAEAVTSIDLRSAAPWDLNALASNLEVRIEDLRASFCCDPGHAISTRACADLRYCQSCLSAGFHAAWFQWPHIERCPQHGMPLRSGCTGCAADIPYVLGADLASSPLRCRTCCRDWVPKLSRPAGRCAPLEARDADLMCRWATCIGEFVSMSEPTTRNRKTGRFIATPTPATRPHVLTLLNRLFDDPPPTLREMTANARGLPLLRPIQAGATLGIVGCPLPSYSQADWPHFDHGFAAHERLVLEARSSLFDAPAIELDQRRGYCLLAASQVVSATMIDRAMAAALGWSASWFSTCQAMVPHYAANMPALGLAAWLARIPLRPPRLAMAAWNRQVTQWLLHDLTLSAQLWWRLVDFMSGRGHYLLHGDVVSPKALALLHGARTS